MTPSVVRAVDAASYRVPLDAPEADGTLEWDHTTIVVARVRAEGKEGLGFTYGPASCAVVIDELLAPVVVGSNPLDVPGVWAAMVRHIRNAGRPGLVSMAISAVDVALWDLKARVLDLPLATLLGQVRRGVPVYGSGGFTSLPVPELRAQLGAWAGSDGIPRVKMKVGTSSGSDLAADVARVRAAREAIGAGTELYVDANGGYTRKQAVRAAASFGESGVTWFEEPVSSDDLDGLREIRDAVELDVAAGEYGYDLAYFGRLCAAGAVDVVQADVSRCGGITEWIRVAALAAGQGLDVSGHCAQSVHAHVACAVANTRHTEYFADHARADRLVFDGCLDPVGGLLVPDLSRPGHGMAVRADADRFRVG